jgi:3-oxoacyl-[acyl-carrier-protein] synthase II
MSAGPSIVITGTGVVCPLGIGRAAVVESLAAARGGIRPISEFDVSELRAKVAGIIEGFNPLEYVRPRKSLKVMARDSQLALAAAELARNDAGLAPGVVDPERFGVVLGAEVIRNALEDVAIPFQASTKDGEYDFANWGEHGIRSCFPLSMLKLLPNMPACHVSIAHDARGPNNTICMREASGLSALNEARLALERGWVDVMLAGATSSRVNAYDLLRYQLGEEMSACDDADRASRPFDVDRDGQVLGEGAALLMLERREFAARRGANVLAELRGCGAAHETVPPGAPISGRAIRTAVGRALNDARLTSADIGFVSAHGLATRAGDLAEAKALHDVLPDCPVFAPKSYIGNLGGACGAVEAAIAVLSLATGSLPPTLHCDRPDPECPVRVVREPLSTGARPACVVVNYTGAGQAAAAVLSAR